MNISAQYNFPFRMRWFLKLSKLSQSLYSGCSIWGVHSPIFVASVGGPISEALLANGLPQKSKGENCFCKHARANPTRSISMCSNQQRLKIVSNQFFTLEGFFRSLHLQDLQISWNKGEPISLWKGNAWSCFPTLVLSNNRLFLSSPWKHYLIFLLFLLKTYRARKL